MKAKDHSSAVEVKVCVWIESIHKDHGRFEEFHEHLECVDRRLDKLDGIGEVSKAHAEAIDLYRQQLLPGWRGIRGVVRPRAVQLGLALNEPLERMHRCLSPSDFGFHNALIDQRDNVRFCDFEYAGWDDPAKTVCDFFCQVEVELPDGKRVGYSGDFGWPLNDVIKVDALVLDATYGNPQSEVNYTQSEADEAFIGLYKH